MEYFAITLHACGALHVSLLYIAYCLFGNDYDYTDL